MDIKDEQLKLFCLSMVASKKQHHDKTGNALGKAILQDMEQCINNTPALAKLSQGEKDGLFEVFISYAPLTPDALDQYRAARSAGSHSDCHSFVPYPHVIFIPTGGGGGGCGDLGEAFLVIAVIILILIALVVTCKAIFDIGFYTNALYQQEGQLIAGLNLALMAAIFSASIYIAVTILFASILASNPLGLAAFAAGSITIIGAYCLYWVTARLIDGLTADSMTNPLNPYKNFTMTQREAKYLESKGIHSLKNRAAIILLQSEIQSDSPTYASEDLPKIKQIRKFRFGEEIPTKLSDLTIFVQSTSTGLSKDASAPEEATLPTATAVNDENPFNMPWAEAKVC